MLGNHASLADINVGDYGTFQLPLYINLDNINRERVQILTVSLTNIYRSATHSANATYRSGNEGVLGKECSQHIKSV